jgi:hypothetical protein
VGGKPGEDHLAVTSARSAPAAKIPTAKRLDRTPEPQIAGDPRLEVLGVADQDRSLDVAKAQNDVRTTLLQGLGGVVLLMGAYFTYRQLRTAREGQITERYTRVIDQLGHAQLDVRLGGIYALERIARDSSADHATIGEVLTAFVRSHAPWPPRLPGQYVATAPIDQACPSCRSELPMCGMPDGASPWQLRGVFATSG